jgi:hypothetical protein
MFLVHRLTRFIVFFRESVHKGLDFVQHPVSFTTKFRKEALYPPSDKEKLPRFGPQIKLFSDNCWTQDSDLLSCDAEQQSYWLLIFREMHRFHRQVATLFLKMKGVRYFETSGITIPILEVRVQKTWALKIKTVEITNLNPWVSKTVHWEPWIWVTSIINTELGWICRNIVG